jgi:hypothetical protein
MDFAEQEGVPPRTSSVPLCFDVGAAVDELLGTTP